MKKSSSHQITIVDVAKEAGVSNATVSRVLNDASLVKPETRQKVLNAMMRLGYVANQQARSLRGAPSQVVGLLVPEVGNSYVGSIIRGIDMQLADSQYDLLLYTTHRRKVNEAAHVATIMRGLADGLLLVLPTNIDAYLQSLQAEQFPHIVIDYQHIESPISSTVQATNRQGAYDAAQYLIQNGHRRIGFVTGLQEIQSSLDRLEGYKAALQDSGIEVDQQLIYQGDFFRTQGYEATQQFLSYAHRPTAIMAANDYCAMGVIDAVKDAGLHVPEDISVIGFDDVPEAKHLSPSLTTVQQPLEQMGRTATQRLLKQLQTPNLPGDRIEISTQLIIRDSSGPAPGS